MSRPPLFTRWGLLLEKDTVAQLGSFLAWAALTQGIFRSVPPPGCWPYVAAVLSLQLGLLAFLDYRDWVRHEVQHEASKLNPGLSVSSMLLLSSPELQDQYHRWMDKTPAVAWHIYFLPLVTLLAVLKYLSRDEYGCTRFALIVPLPSMVLAFVRVAMDIRGAPKQFLSIASLVIIAYILTAATELVALNDPCVLSIGPDWMSSAGNAAFVAITTAAHFASTPCTMQHLPALCVITGLCDFPGFYMLSQRRNGGLGLMSYPNHHVELIIIIAAAKTAALLVGAAVRFRLTHENMRAFLRSAKPHRH